MVTINGTIFVELVLFLIFLWGANRFIFRRAFNVMDDREHAIGRDKEAAEEGAREAEASEHEYQNAMKGARRAANEKIREARRQEKEAKLATLVERKAESDDAVAQVRAAAMTDVEGQRASYKKLTPDLVKATLKSLHIGGPST